MARLFPQDHGSSTLSPGARAELSTLQDLHQRPSVELPGSSPGTRENHRSPRRIARYVKRELGIDFKARNDLPGDPVEHIAYNNAQDQIGRAGGHVQALIERGYSPERTTLLTVHGLKRSSFAWVEAVGGRRLCRHAGYTEDGHQQMTADPLILGSIYSVRLSVMLDQGEYAVLTRLGAELDLPAAWMIRRAVSEFVARHRGGIATDLPLHSPKLEAALETKTGESSGK